MTEPSRLTETDAFDLPEPLRGEVLQAFADAHARLGTSPDHAPMVAEVDTEGGGFVLRAVYPAAVSPAPADDELPPAALRAMEHIAGVAAPTVAVPVAAIRALLGEVLAARPEAAARVLANPQEAAAVWDRRVADLLAASVDALAVLPAASGERAALASALAGMGLAPAGAAR